MMDNKLILNLLLIRTLSLLTNKPGHMNQKANRKPFFFLFAFISLAFIQDACTVKSSVKEVLTSKIQYDVPVNNNDSQLDWWINNIEGSKREPFLKRMMEAAENGDVKVFDYYNKPMTPAQVKYFSTDTIYQTLLRTRPPYEEYDTMIIESVTYRDIVKVRFMEEWKWDRRSLEMDKKIVAIGPVIEKEIAGARFTQLLFWISLDESFPGK